MKGTNEISIEVYVNMKDLAGVEDVYIGPSASRTDYEVYSDLNESLLFVKEEIEFMCRLEELKGVGGDSINDIMKVFIHYCESAARKDYHKGIELLHELVMKISFSEDKIKRLLDKQRSVSSYVKNLKLAESKNVDSDNQKITSLVV